MQCLTVNLQLFTVYMMQKQTANTAPEYDASTHSKVSILVIQLNIKLLFSALEVFDIGPY